MANPWENYSSVDVSTEPSEQEQPWNNYASSANPTNTEQTLQPWNNYNNQDQYQQDSQGRWPGDEGYNLEEEEYADPSTGDIVKGVGAEVLASGAGTIAGGALGALGGPLAPITVPLGMAVGGFAGGFLGSLWAQDIEGQEEKSYGRAIAAGTVGAIPFGGTGAKAITGATKITGKMIAGAAGREAVKGGVLGATEATIATQIDEGRMPTKEEYAAYVGGGTLFGGALGAASPKIGKSMDKFFGKTPEEIDAAIGRGEIQFNDFEKLTFDFIPDTKKTPPPIPETRGQGQQYHGTSNELSTLLNVDDAQSEWNIYGQGFYTTEAMDIAKGYSKKGNGENRIIYNVSEKQPVNFANIDELKFKDLGLQLSDDFMVAIDDYPDDLTVRQVFDIIRDEVDLPTYEIQEGAFYPINDKIQELGYGGIQHIGGAITGRKPHNVKIYFDPGNQLDLNENIRFDVPELTQLKRKVKKLKGQRSDLPYGDQAAQQNWRNELIETENRIKELNKSKEQLAQERELIINEVAPRLRADFADARIAMESKLAADEIANKGTSKLGQAWASIKPSAYLKPKANQAAIDYSRNIKNSQDLANKIARKIKLETERNPNIAAEIDDIIDGGNTPMSKEVYDSVGAEIQKYQDTRLEYQKEMLELVDSDAYRSMSEEGKGEFQKTLQDSIAGKTYNRQDYRMFLDKDFKPDPKLKQAALIELTEKMGSQEAAIDHLNKLENSSARTKAFDPRSKGSGQGVDSVMKRRSNPGPAEKAWLGEVKDSPEKVIGTLTGISKSVSRAKADQTIGEELINSGVASRTRGSGDMVELTFRGTGEKGSGIYAMPEVQMALNQVYLPEVDNKTNSMVINGLQDLYRAGVAGSKGAKVLLNTIAYPVQAYSNAITLAGQGINPFKGSMRGMEIALSEFGYIQDIRKSPKARRAVLDDIDDMNKYGIKGVSINDSDIRNTLDNGFFSEKLSKLSDPLGKAYSAADTMGRYVGWKSTQKTLKKQFPKAGEDLPAYKKAMADSEIAMSQGDEIGAQRFMAEAQNVKDDVIKAQSAKLINDTYQNYDKLSNFVKTLSRWGVMPQFASFTAEFARNQYQQGKVIKEMLSGTYGAADNLGPANVRQMKLDGAKKLASLTAVYGSTYGLIEGVKAASGVDSSKEDALRNLVYPDYDKNKDLMVSLDEDGKTGWTANMSYISPHALGQSAFKAGMSGEDEDSLIGLLKDEMVGEGSFVAGAVFRAIENRDKYGREISSELDGYRNTKDRIEYAITDIFKPGTYREVEKLKGSLSGDNNYTKADLAMRQAGWRKNKFDVDKRTISTIRNNAKAGKAASSEFNFLNKKNNSPEQLNAIWEDSNRLRRDSFDAIVTNDESMIALGRTEDDRVKLMKAAGVSGEMILDIFARKYRDLSKTQALSTSDIFSTIEGSYAQKRKQIIEMRKQDRAMGDKLLAKLSRERSADRLNLSAIDNVFLGLDTAERASRIMQHPNPKGYLEQLRQKRMVSTDLNNIVRMKLRAQGQ